MRILLVEDDEELGRRTSARLTNAGFAVDHARTVAEAIDWPDLHQAVAIILDLGLPDGDGFDLLRAWRARGLTTPILILTARGNWQEKVDGLNAGADDFVVKPVRFEELLARIHALGRRLRGRSDNELRVGPFVLDPVAQTVRQGEEPLALSRQEFRLLQLLMQRPGHIVSQSSLLEGLYALEEERDQNAVEVQVSRLRRKIGKHVITTVRGLGYRLDA